MYCLTDHFRTLNFWQVNLKFGFFHKIVKKPVIIHCWHFTEKSSNFAFLVSLIFYLIHLKTKWGKDVGSRETKVRFGTCGIKKVGVFSSGFPSFTPKFYQDWCSEGTQKVGISTGLRSTRNSLFRYPNIRYYSYCSCF